MHFRIHHYPRDGRPFFQFMNWRWRGFIIHIGDRQFDLFWRSQWSPGVED